MSKSPTSESPTEIDEPPLEDSFYEVPPELEEGARTSKSGRSPARGVDEDEDGQASGRIAPRFPFEKVAIGVGAVLVLGIALTWFRAESRGKAVRQGIAQAEELLWLDTADGYRRAAALLEPLAKLDPIEAGSARAFALAMLASDYHDRHAEATARELLVAPSRADAVPRYASLAFGALALGRNALGDAQVELHKASGLEGAAEDRSAPVPWSQALQARVSLRAGTLESAIEYATGAAARPGFAAGLAVHGDVARRAKRDDRTARAAYEAALAASPAHPRAAYGLAKLALAGEAPEAEARDALGRILASGDATPFPERGRAALHLAALRLRDGEATEVVRRELAGGLDESAADWLMGAARAEAGNRGPYKAVRGPPAALESASDDDPKELYPRAPEPPPPPPAARVAPPPAKAVAHAKPAQKAKAPPRKATVKAAPAKSKGTTAKATSKASPKKKAPAKTAVKSPSKKPASTRPP
jgi:hypothetical protein